MKTKVEQKQVGMFYDCSKVRHCSLPLTDATGYPPHSVVPESLKYDYIKTILSCANLLFKPQKEIFISFIGRNYFCDKLETFSMHE